MLLERTNLWLKAPKYLIELGLLTAGRVYRRLQKAVYGLNEAPRRWFLKLIGLLLDNNFCQSLIDPCLFFVMRGGQIVVAIIIYVDDVLVGGNAEWLDWTDKLIEKLLPVGATDKTDGHEDGC